jgi:hypothetical protein
MSGAANGRPVLGMAHTANKHASLFAGIDTAEEKKDLEHWHHYFFDLIFFPKICEKEETMRRFTAFARKTFVQQAFVQQIFAQQTFIQQTFVQQTFV